LANELPNFDPQATHWEMLDNLRRTIVGYCCNESNPRNGLIADRTEPGSPSSIAAVGMGLSGYIVAVERDIRESLSRVKSGAQIPSLEREKASAESNRRLGNKPILRAMAIPSAAERPGAQAIPGKLDLENRIGMVITSSIATYRTWNRQRLK
jgi:hypothetical protein